MTSALDLMEVTDQQHQRNREPSGKLRNTAAYGNQADGYNTSTPLPDSPCVRAPAWRSSTKDTWQLEDNTPYLFVKSLKQSRSLL